MAEIGPTLQSARTGAGIDIAEIEAETKIRAKYLRALEQEDWDQLPGPTYVRSFLRTYADALGLDGRMLVEQYRLRHERLSDQDLQPITPPGRQRREQRRGGPPRLAVVAGLVVVLIAALWWLGTRGDDGGSGDATTATEARADTAARTTATGTRTPAAARVVRVQIRATGPIFVCMQDARGRRVVDGATLEGGDRTRTFRSTAFRVRLGNGDARVYVNGRARRLPDRSPQAYRISRNGLKPIALDASPGCAQG